MARDTFFDDTDHSDGRGEDDLADGGGGGGGYTPPTHYDHSDAPHLDHSDTPHSDIPAPHTDDPYVPIDPPPHNDHSDAPAHVDDPIPPPPSHTDVVIVPPPVTHTDTVPVTPPPPPPAGVQNLKIRFDPPMGGSPDPFNTSYRSGETGVRRKSYVVYNDENRIVSIRFQNIPSGMIISPNPITINPSDTRAFTVELTNEYLRSLSVGRSTKTVGMLLSTENLPPATHADVPLVPHGDHTDAGTGNHNDHADVQHSDAQSYTHQDHQDNVVTHQDHTDAPYIHSDIIPVHSDIIIPYSDTPYVDTPYVDYVDTPYSDVPLPHSDGGGSAHVDRAKQE